MQRRFEDARKAFTRAIELNPSSSTPYVVLAQVFTEESDYDHALEILKKAGGPKDPLRLIQQTFIFAVRGDTEQALSSLDKELKAGYKDFPALESNPHLLALRSNAKFQSILDRYRL
jgi:tetratricopeptide (TPR) repeat protein